MIIGLEGFGSVWSIRLASGSRRAAFYNTTGITTNGKLRHRTRVFGQLRFNEVGGFHPEHIERSIGRTFHAGGNLDRGQRTLLLHHCLEHPKVPDYYVFEVSSSSTGVLQVQRDGWKSESVVLLALSQIGDQQEAMLLMPPFSWIRGGLGRFVAEPNADRAWRAFLQLKG